MAALEGTLPLAEMDHIAMVIRDNLHFYVAGIDEILLQVDLIVSERGRGFRPSNLTLLEEVFCLPNEAHAPASATGGGFNNHRIANFFRDLN
jgi:hypothetical protein